MREKGFRLAASLALLLLTLCALSADTKADPITINFDDMTSGATSGPVPGGIDFFAAYTDSSASRIVTTTGPVVLSSPAAHTAPNALFARQLNPLAMLRNNVGGRFLIESGSQTFFAKTDFISLWVVGTTPGQTDNWTVAFYSDTINPNDLTSGLLGTVTGTSDQFVSFHSDIGVHAFLLINSGPNRHEGIDTVTFDPVQTPEPASLILLSSGVAGLGLRLYRGRRRSHGSGESL
jgi:hypothetical protein